MIMRWKSRTGSGIFTLTLALCGATALAQPAETGKPKAAQGGQSGAADSAGFEEILVTARLRSERLQDVPVAATDYINQDLARYNTANSTSIAAQSPSLGVQPTTGSAQLNVTLRGIGMTPMAPSVDQAVSINIDGIQFSQANVLRLGLHDLKRVEILKGPQALFFGKNSTAGIISLTSAGPGNEFAASLRTGYEFAHERKFVEAVVSSPLTETLGARVSVYYGNQNGWFRNDAVPVPPVLVPASLGGRGEFTPAGIGPSTRNGPEEEEIFLRGTAFESPDGVFDATLKTAYSDFGRKDQLYQLAMQHRFGWHLFRN